MYRVRNTAIDDFLKRHEKSRFLCLDEEKENGHGKEEKTKKKNEDPTEGGEKKLSLQEQAIQELVSESRKELEVGCSCDV